MLEGKPDNEKEKINSALARDERIRNKKVALIESVPKDQVIEMWDSLSECVKQLKEKYPNDYMNRTAYHALIGSTVRGVHPNLIEEDFPGEDSVEKLLERVEKEWREKHKEKEQKHV